jgi:hypothetical protein
VHGKSHIPSERLGTIARAMHCEERDLQMPPGSPLPRLRFRPARRQNAQLSPYKVDFSIPHYLPVSADRTCLTTLRFSSPGSPMRSPDVAAVHGAASYGVRFGLSWGFPLGPGGGSQKRETLQMPARRRANESCGNIGSSPRNILLSGREPAATYAQFAGLAGNLDPAEKDISHL